MEIKLKKSYFLKKTYIIWKMTERQNGRRLFEKVYIDKKTKNPN